MDLVDLDRVLDEFEAKEEQHLETSMVNDRAVSDGSTRKKPATPEFPVGGVSFDQKVQLSNGHKRESSLLKEDLVEETFPETATLIDLAEPVSANLVPLALEVSAASSWMENERCGVDSLLFSNDPALSVMPTLPIAPALPPDITGGVVASIVDQEPEDPKTASDIDLVAGQHQQPPPDVVAGHQISHSRSSTPSPTSTVKRPIGFYDDAEAAGERVSEEDLDRYLNELDEQIGQPSTRTSNVEPVLRPPTSDDLKSYLANLEKINGTGEISSCPVEGENVAMEKVAEESRKSIDEQQPVESVVNDNAGSSTKDAFEIGMTEELSAPRQIDEHSVKLDKEARPNERQSPNLEDDDDDTYVMLAFTAPNIGDPKSISSGNCPDLKTEIEQALLASRTSSGGDSGLTKGTTGQDTETRDSEFEKGGSELPGSFPLFVTSSHNGGANDTTAESAEESFAKMDVGDTAMVGDPAQSIPEESFADTALVGDKGPAQSAQVKGGSSNKESALELDGGADEAAGTSNNGESTATKRQLVTVCTLDAVAHSASSVIGSSQLKLTESELQLGRVQPVWIPDNDSIVCMLCESKFTLIRRRHHCRACGRVLCNVCCNQRAKLPYMVPTTSSEVVDSGKHRQHQEARVCNSCYERLKRIEEHEKDATKQSPAMEVAESGNADNSGLSSTEATMPTASSTIVANASAAPQRPPVLKREGTLSRRHGEPKQVVFSDGIKPGGDLTESPPTTATSPSQPGPSTILKSLKASSALTSVGKGGVKGARARELECLFALPESAASSDESTGLSHWPPMLDKNGSLNYVAESDIAKQFAETMQMPIDDETKVLTFALKRNLHVHVKLIQIDCCLHRLVWCFATNGLRGVSQDEILIVAECSKNGDDEEYEKTPPLDAFIYFNALYDEALKGKPQGDLTYAVFNQLGMSPVDSSIGYFGSKDNAGFIHYRPTYQCLQHLCLPEHPFLVGILIQRSEVSWAKVLPLRLLLRLGVEYRYYPYPLLSDRSRKALFYETGHTIMNLLTDMRNFTYTIPSISGCTIALDDDKTVILIPFDQYNQVMKILQSSNEHVLAWAASLHKSADAHLVCVQQQDTLSYASQTISREHHERKLTGACFVVFNASLKAGGPVSRISIVEDGLMIQIRSDAMERLRQTLRDQQPFDLLLSNSGERASSDQNAAVEIRWTPGPEKLNRFVLKSRIDGRILTDVPRYRLHGKTVEATNGQKLIRLIELYLLRDGSDDENAAQGEPDDLQSMVRQVATACSAALLPFVDILIDSNMRTISVRFVMGADMVEYSIGSNEQPLPDEAMAAIDDVLIPLLHSRAMGGSENGTGNENQRLCRVELVLRLLDL